MLVRHIPFLVKVVSSENKNRRVHYELGAIQKIAVLMVDLLLEDLGHVHNGKDAGNIFYSFTHYRMQYISLL